MADTLQKVFLIFVRPYYETTSVGGNAFKVFPYPSKASVPLLVNAEGGYKTLENINATGDFSSPTKINRSGKYTNDPWFLHSSHTSYEEMKIALKEVMGTYGTSNIKCAVYVPIDVDIVPNE